MPTHDVVGRNHPGLLPVGNNVIVIARLGNTKDVMKTEQ